ncbi:hypothetical protein KQ944_02415 [Bacillus subtilis]|uniref:acyltransferase family protein n=1 Tax=Pseudochrobactrum asaccharolyticum TaxID=354351 RepID=UPI001F340F33|nr:acyltransferase family protein [Pseudochrobactrum asaccharolyticum]MCF7644290.1 hypothetical protein [Pseudochrobactrum asaccharolyticum]MCF7670471.1 hypothetical protein [Bacillus subtilis]
MENVLYTPKIVTAFVLLLICSSALPILMRVHAGINLPVQYIGLHVSFLYCGMLFRLAMIDKKQAHGQVQSSLLSFGGSISYSIYLFHGIAALLVYQFLPLTENWTDLLTGLVSLGLTILISHSVYKYLETPMIALGRKTATRNEPRATIAVPQS